ncbi:MAG TPA: pyridoxamine 5'-phosphate oxidase family protein [Gaiellaceae bacterium]|nr:pyridoxamine 5'-phosphate oxidase family protein [Gaiellaceae bacterium]
MSWARFAAEAPELAALCRARLEEPGVALLGTLRRDGAPRIDPVEPHFAGDELVLGAMPGTAKAHALRRDPRCVLHSTIAGPDTGETDVKLSGRVTPSAARVGWWAERPSEEVEVYAFQVEEAVAVEWELAASRMVVRRWTAAKGETVTERTYP